MLHQFLAANREIILAKTRRKTDIVSEDKPTTEISERGLPQFYDYLTGRLERAANGEEKGEEKDEGPDTTAKHGKEMKRLGYTVSQVVQGYGFLCQAITEAALDAKTNISAEESQILNLTLDLAVAEAVTGFSKRFQDTDCTKRIGSLSHELRNALAAATIAHTMAKRVGHGPNMNAVVERSLARMRDILDRSVSEIRMENKNNVEQSPVNLLDIVEEVEATAAEEARLRGLTLHVEVDPKLKIVTDSQFLVSALSNLVQNAIKFTKKDGSIWIRGRRAAEGLLLDVEDQCGGLPAGLERKLFVPFTNQGAEKTGLGLGLSISSQAVTRIGGTLTARDLPSQGCVFLISLPKPESKSDVEESPEPAAVERT